MTLRENSGAILEIRRSAGELCLEWKTFYSLSGEGVACYESPNFIFCDASWCLRVWPNWMKTSGWVWLCLIRNDEGLPENFTIAVGIRDPHGVEKRRVEERKFPNDDGWCWQGFCFKSETTGQVFTSMLEDVISITCEMKTLSKARGVSYYREASVQTDSEIRKLDKETQTFDKKVDDDDDNNENNEDNVGKASKNEKNAKDLRQIKKTKISLPNRHGNVILNLKAILAGGRRADFTLKSGGREWHVHRAILEGRSGHFDALFRGEWAEREEVRFDDVTEGAMDGVLQFIYAGEVGDMSVENACRIYAASRKFLLEDLKSVCVEYLKQEMCPDMVCMALAVSETYEEGDLKQSAVECFFRESNVIVATEGWKRLKENHPAIIGELFEETIKRERKNRSKE